MSPVRFLSATAALVAAWFMAEQVIEAKPPRDVPAVFDHVTCAKWRCGKELRLELALRLLFVLQRCRLHKALGEADRLRAAANLKRCRKGVRAGRPSRRCMVRAAKAVQAKKVFWSQLVKPGEQHYKLKVGVVDLVTPKGDRVLSGECRGCNQKKLLALVDRLAPGLIHPVARTPSCGEDGQQWAPILGGSFVMGTSGGEDSEQPPHKVTVASFRMGEEEVTVRQYLKCVKAAECRPPEWAEPGSRYNLNTGKEKRYRGFTAGDQPIVGVSWSDARRFCRWAGGRLPTEAEWEYAARSGGKPWKYPWGNSGATCKRAVMTLMAQGCEQKRTLPGCSRIAGNTAHGLCDMAGNVWEWVEDCWHGNYSGAPADGSAWTKNCDATRRVYRGGSWRNNDKGLRTARRRRGRNTMRSNYLGIRCAR